MAGSELHEAEVESRWEAAPAVLVVIVLQVAIGVASWHQHWSLWRLPWWSWLVLIVPEAMLFAALALSWPRRQIDQLGRRREVALALFGLVGIGNALALLALIAALIGGYETNGGPLLFKAGTIWSTNVIAFGLWFWALDRGGPIRRREADPPPPDFQFPQMENPGLAEPGWHPRLLDYVYLSFTNSVAFSPTDAMPLTRRVKLLMLLEASASAVTVLLVAARAVNILR
ncbi:MAG: hypothetical protein QOE98_2810 [Gaiellaceae bacterium]|nr:hypothetical protein [Gaiellaceae bacterium]